MGYAPAVPNSPAPGSRAHQILDRLEMWGQKLGLERIRSVLARLGDPQLEVPCVLVAGTNGKGSTTAALAAMLEASGYHTGLYNSPHLESPEERIRLGGVTLDTERMGELLERVVAAAEAESGEPPTYFEALTACAFLAFAEDPVDVAVLEVGLGGRLDATNVCEPVLSVITPIAFDHQEHLGHTLSAIAGEKAGIMRAGRPVVAWFETGSETHRTLADQAAARGAELIDASAGVLRASAERVVVRDERGFAGEVQHLEIETRRATYSARSRYCGAHQAQNLSLALRCAEELASTFDALTPASCVRGLEAVWWPGRLEWVVADAPTGRLCVLLDGAHNEAGAEALADHLEGLPLELDLVCGVLREKNVGRVLPRLARTAERVVATRPDSPRALDPDQLVEATRALGDLGGKVSVDPDPHRALQDTLERCLATQAERGTERAVVVCGSLYLVGAAREQLRDTVGEPPATTATSLFASLQQE